VFNIFKRKGKQIMLTDEQIKALTPEQKAELLSKLQVEQTDTESQTATIEVEATDTVEETTAQVEEVVEEVVKPQEEPTVEEKQILTELYLETKLEEVNRTF
jgi:Spy/CpxP family protein refolding chaperone